MKEYTVDIGGKNFCKKGEDICGDSFKVFQTPDSTVVVLSDGLGSGVQANVLSTLTVEVVGGLVSGNLSTHEVVETLIATLPVCKRRGIAYSTFSILRLYDTGHATLVEYDSPAAIRLRGGVKVSDLKTSEVNVLGKSIRESHFRVRPDDMIVQMSDGIIHAGVACTLPMGWQEDGVRSYLSHVAALAEGDPDRLSDYVINQAHDLWLRQPGDDGTVVTAKYRKALNTTLITGPAGSKEDMPAMLDKFLSSPGRKIVCGGTTSHIIAERLGSEVEIDFSYMDSDLPPTARIGGIDLVTEGILTLNRVVKYLKDGIPDDTKNAATELVEVLKASDGIGLMVGTARNPALQNANFPPEMLLRRTVVDTLADLLRVQGKTVEVSYH